MVVVTVPVNPTATAPILTATTTTIVPANHYTSFLAYPSAIVYPALVPTTTTTTVAPALLPKKTNVPDNHPKTIDPAHEPIITTTVHSNTPTHVVPEPDIATTI